MSLRDINLDNTQICSRLLHLLGSRIVFSGTSCSSIEEAPCLFNSELASMMRRFPFLFLALSGVGLSAYAESEPIYASRAEAEVACAQELRQWVDADLKRPIHVAVTQQEEEAPIPLDASILKSRAKSSAVAVTDLDCVHDGFRVRGIVTFRRKVCENDHCDTVAAQLSPLSFPFETAGSTQNPPKLEFETPSQAMDACYDWRHADRRPNFIVRVNGVDYSRRFRFCELDLRAGRAGVIYGMEYPDSIEPGSLLKSDPPLPQITRTFSW